MRYILTDSFSAAGNIKAAGISNHNYIMPIEHEFVDGPVFQATDLYSLFKKRHTVFTKMNKTFLENLADIKKRVTQLEEFVEDAIAHGELELWFSEKANAQLSLIHLINWLRTIPNALERTVVLDLHEDLGEMHPTFTAEMKVIPKPIDENAIRTASECWLAYCSDTPEACYDLLKSDLTSFPYLRGVILKLLGELPNSKTGLTNTQTQIIEFIDLGVCRVGNLIRALVMNKKNMIYDYWRHGEILIELCHCKEPLLIGIEEKEFSLDLHDDIKRYKKFNNAYLELTPFARSILAQKENFLSKNLINRWWGGTKLENNQLWRWDVENFKLIEG